jgi:transcriptional regulator with XRE-family HTH domain
MSSNPRITRQVGNALRRIRADRGAKQCQVAELAGITKAMLSTYENGRQAPSFSTLAKVLSTLECSPEEFGRYFGPWASVETIQRNQQ